MKTALYILKTVKKSSDGVTFVIELNERTIERGDINTRINFERDRIKLT